MLQVRVPVDGAGAEAEVLGELDPLALRRPEPPLLGEVALAGVALEARVTRVDVRAHPGGMDVLRGLIEAPEPLAGARVHEVAAIGGAARLDPVVDLKARARRVDVTEVVVVGMAHPGGPQLHAVVIEHR